MGQKGQCIQIHAAASQKYIQKTIRQYQFYCKELFGDGEGNEFDNFMQAKMLVNTESAVQKVMK